MVPQPRNIIPLDPSKLEPSRAQISRLTEACPWSPTGKGSTAQVVEGPSHPSSHIPSLMLGINSSRRQVSYDAMVVTKCWMPDLGRASCTIRAVPGSNPGHFTTKMLSFLLGSNPGHYTTTKTSFQAASLYSSTISFFRCLDPP